MPGPDIRPGWVLDGFPKFQTEKDLALTLSRRGYGLPALNAASASSTDRARWQCEECEA
jgi:hypothetical protein